MKKHVLVYDVDWWVLGIHARIIQRFYPNLEVMSCDEILNLTYKVGADEVNASYEIISTMCLGIAAMLLDNGIRVDSSVAASYVFVSRNQGVYREWCDDILPNTAFIENVIKRINKIGAINYNLSQVLQRIVPSTEIQYMPQFVDSDYFKQYDRKNRTNEFVIGWVGSTWRHSKNYHTLYKNIKNAFKNDPRVRFVEATQESRLPITEMPAFYNSLDLLLITAANEGGPATALEAYSCGTPVLSTNIGYVKEVASSDSKFLILDSDTPNDFIQKVNYLIDNRESLYEVGNNCRKNIEANWTIENNIRHWLSTLFNIET